MQHTVPNIAMELSYAAIGVYVMHCWCYKDNIKLHNNNAVNCNKC